MTQKVPMTVQGAKKLKNELNFLKSVERPKIIAAIAEARSHGDLKENAEYIASREQQSFLEGKIKLLESKINNAQIIDISKLHNSGRIIMGATVILLSLSKKTEETYQIVGEDEADINKKKISLFSPLARGLIGKEKGDKVEITTPSGLSKYKIINVQYI